MGKKTKITKNIKPPKRDWPGAFEEKSNILFPLIGGAIGHILFPGLGGIFAGTLIGNAIGSTEKKEGKMSKIPVFYSFHFGSDVMRVQQVRNIGSIEGNAPTTPNDWETLKRTGKKAVENWIDQNMKYKRCIVVLIGSETASRPWVKYEIEKAWNDGKAIIGIHIHNLKCPRNGTSRKGANPFDSFTFNDGRKLSAVVPCYDPNPNNAYQDIANNISSWINHAISNKAN